jgi:hypothetical protein
LFVDFDAIHQRRLRWNRDRLVIANCPVHRRNEETAVAQRLNKLIGYKKRVAHHNNARPLFSTAAASTNGPGRVLRFGGVTAWLCGELWNSTVGVAPAAPLCPMASLRKTAHQR